MARRRHSHRGDDGGLLRVHPAGRVCETDRGPLDRRRQRRDRAGRQRDRARTRADHDLRPVGEPAPRSGRRGAAREGRQALMTGAPLATSVPAPSPATSLGQPNTVAIVWFLGFVVITLAITYWASRR